MTAQELNTYIDRVLGNSIRCLLPSYWWKRILKLVVNYADSGISEHSSKLSVIQDKIAAHELFLQKYKGKIVLTNGPDDFGSTYVIADGEEYLLPGGETKEFPFMYEFIVSISGLSIESIDTKDVNTALVENMSGMFSGCSNVEHLDVSLFQTSNVKSMSSMFHYCSKLQELDVSNFDTSKVESMNYMFGVCGSLERLDVSKFKTSKVKDMSAMFAGCTSLTDLYVGNFDTSNVTDMAVMFDGCESLDYLDVSNFDTSKVVYMGNMFYRCSNLETLDLRNFNTANVTEMRFMFGSCSKLSTLDLSSFDTSKVTDMVSMFNGCYSMNTLILGENFFKTPLVTRVDFRSLENWSAESAIPSLVTNSYDRASNGLSTLEIRLHSNVYAYLTDEYKATMEAKGYTVTEG